jgi:hypothetical protein
VVFCLAQMEKKCIKKHISGVQFGAKNFIKKRAPN